MKTCLYRAAAGLVLAGASPALAASGQPADAGAPAAVREIDPATLTLPSLAFTPSADSAKDFDKYYYFHRDGTDFATALADLRDCDALARGLVSSLTYQQAPYPYAGTMAGAVGGAIGNALAAAIIGSAQKRAARRVNMRRCMFFKGYQRYGRGQAPGLSRPAGEGRLRPETGDGGARPMKYRLAAALAAGALAGSLLPGAALAAPKDYESVNDKPAIALDPAAAYLLVQTWSDTAGATPLTFIRVPAPGDVADYRARRAAALAKAHGKWVRQHGQWAQDLADWKKGKMPGQARPVEPIEPTEFNLAFPALAMENMVTLGPLYRFAKTGGRSTYLHKMKPGRYIFYGPLATFPQPLGNCLCMGSIAFELKPGTITFAGTVTLNWLAAREAAKAAGKELPKTELDLPESVNTVSWAPPGDGAAVDPRLASYRIVPAELHASGRVPNYFGLTVDRITELPGVVRYERDRVIDAKSGETAADLTP
jgi:hypothetical protein